MALPESLFCRLHMHYGLSCFLREDSRKVKKISLLDIRENDEWCYQSRARGACRDSGRLDESDAVNVQFTS